MANYFRLNWHLPQLAFNHPYIYSANVPASFATRYPNLASAAVGKHVRKPPYFHVASLRSEAATTFVSFAKHSRFNKDLYADLVAPSLRVGLLVETWPNGPGRMNSRSFSQVDFFQFN